MDKRGTQTYESKNKEIDDDTQDLISIENLYKN